MRLTLCCMEQKGLNKNIFAGGFSNIWPELPFLGKNMMNGTFICIKSDSFVHCIMTSWSYFSRSFLASVPWLKACLKLSEIASSLHQAVDIA